MRVSARVWPSAAKSSGRKAVSYTHLKPPTSGTVFDAMVGTVTDVDVQEKENGSASYMEEEFGHKPTDEEIHTLVMSLSLIHICTGQEGQRSVDYRRGARQVYGHGSGR